ncbi:homoserine dehydrogenase [Sphingomonas sp. H160509]|nr:homoserine dehydrogenase [Sphingomonas sp. H160509]MDD1449892.1 homoserine dehydrogenase [Sphingomonas sp. H160509]
MLLSRRERYRQFYRTDVRLVAACGSRSGISDRAGLELDRLKSFETGASGPDFIRTSGADLLIEAGPSDFRTGGPGLAYIASALSAGNDAIVISKGALVHSGRHLRDLARASGARLKISGATAAALPTIDLLDYALRGCSILRIEGILNATTNHLLHAMSSGGMGFAESLAEAQDAGFAESDLRNDIEGWDTACKVLLLANFGLDADLTMEDVSVEGIQSISEARIAAWRAEALVPKLVGRIWYEGGTARASVGVQALDQADPLAHVTDNNKAIRITTDFMGDVVAMGEDRGRPPRRQRPSRISNIFSRIVSWRLSGKTDRYQQGHSAEASGFAGGLEAGRNYAHDLVRRAAGGLVRVAAKGGRGRRSLRSRNRTHLGNDRVGKKADGQLYGAVQ